MKDQCDTCVLFKEGNVNKAQYDIYIEKKNEAKMNSSVLLCPKLLASSVYYKLKLQLHDFTIYTLNDG